MPIPSLIIFSISEVKSFIRWTFDNDFIVSVSGCDFCEQYWNARQFQDIICIGIDDDDADDAIGKVGL